MYKLSFLICFAFLFTKSAKSQTTDTINLNASEQQFSDSIAQVNEQNEDLKASRDAYNEGLLLLGTENYIEAITHFTNAITIDSIFSEAYLSRAKCYEGQNDELAIVDYLKAFELDSSKVFPLYSVAALQFKTDKELAKQTYSLIIALNETEFKAISQLGIIAFLAKEYNTAEQYFTQSLAINTNAYTLNDRGSCYRK